MKYLQINFGDKSPARHSLVLIFALLAQNIHIEPSHASDSDTLPKRAIGLWRISTITPEVGMNTNQVCITDDDSIIGTQPIKCTKPDIKRSGEDILVTFECPAHEGKEVTSMFFSGNYNSKYRAQSKITYIGKNNEMHMTGFTIQAELLKNDCN
jgi:hypothetical protein